MTIQRESEVSLRKRLDLLRLNTSVFWDEWTDNPHITPELKSILDTINNEEHKLVLQLNNMEEKTG